MKTLFTLCIVCTISFSQAQSTFRKAYGGINNDVIYSVKQTFDGGYIMVGKSESFGTGISLYLIKTNSSGDTLWTKTFTGENNFGESIQQTSDSGYIISGTAADSLSNSNVYLIKTDNNGNILWQKCYEGGEGSSVFQNMDHGYIICGTMSAGFSYSDISLIRTDSSGNPLWIERITLNIGGSYRGYSVQQTKDGRFIVGGVAHTGDYYGILLKVYGNGTLAWSKAYYSGTQNYLVQYVQQTNDGNYILAGYADDFPLLIKTDSLGNVVWTKEYQSVSFSYAPVFSAQQTNDMGYVVAGSNWSNNLYPFLFKTDRIGTILWARQYSSCKGTPFIYSSVSQTMDGGYILCSPVDSVGAGGKDFGLIKTDSMGGNDCSDSIIVLSDSALTTVAIAVSPTVYALNPGILPNNIIGSGGLITTICSNTTSVNNIDIDNKPLNVFPNPFSNMTTFSFSLSRSQKVSLNIFNVTGHLISTIADKDFEAGENELMLNANEMNSGVYFLQFKSDNNIRIEKLVVAK